ncbi:ATP-binding protein, partial [Kineococcus glutinatus]|uniref:ATP-binding protein n=1 Tax=Kineococcus glutinatus TaxID=1070872 RepID=UPI0031EF2B84
DGTAGGAGALQSLVSRLRRALAGAVVVEQSGPGYRLVLDPAAVDTARFAAAAAAGREALTRGDAEEAAALLAEGLALWRGPALADLDQPAEAARWEELRLEAVADRAEADLRRGALTGLTAELGALSRQHPHQERLAALRVRALHAAGRSAEALTAYEEVRARLAEELGADPSAVLRAAHLEVLRAADADPTTPTAHPAPTRAAPVAGPPRTGPAPGALPHPLTSFVGREADAGRVAGLLERVRLVTLVGPGGAGKTRLATEVARRVGAARPRPVHLVTLAPVADPRDVVSAVADAVGVAAAREVLRAERSTPPDSRRRLLDTLADRDVLLVVDNCEHVVDATAALVEELLARCPRVRVLATSREALGVDGEVLHPLGPLPVPEEDADAAGALRSPAVRLFADRAAAASPDFTVDASTVAAVVAVVRRLDGLPLALELAAARLRTMPVQEVAARLSDRFALLAGGRRTAVARHRTLRAVVDWSWDLLTDAEQRVLQRLSVFATGPTTAAAVAVCGREGVPAADVPDLLAALVDKSLVQRAERGGEVRSALLETIKEYAAERLAAAGELETARAAHARWFADAAAGSARLLAGPEQLAVARRLDVEAEDGRAALRWFVEHRQAADALRLVVPLTWWWTVLSRHERAAEWLREALSVVPGGAPRTAAVVEAEALLTVNAVLTADAALVSAADAEARLGAVAAELDAVPPADPGGSPLLAVLRLLLVLLSGRTAEFHDGVEAAAASADPWLAAMALSMRAAHAENEGDLAVVRRDAAEAVRRLRGLGEHWGLAGALRMVGQVRSYDGDLEGAAAAYAEAYDLLEPFGVADDSVLLRMRLADLAVRRHRPQEARAQVAALLAAVESTSGTSRQLRTWAGVTGAGVALALGDPAEARRLLEPVLARVDGDPASAMWRHERTVAHTSATSLALAEGDPGAAAAHLVAAHEAGLATRDMPVLAG